MVAYTCTEPCPHVSDWHMTGFFLFLHAPDAYELFSHKNCTIKFTCRLDYAMDSILSKSAYIFSLNTNSVWWTTAVHSRQGDLSPNNQKSNYRNLI